jgi:hypothetical protein
VHWGKKLARYFDELQIGWTAWSWHNDPLLVQRYAPTKFGKMVRSSLTEY